MKQTTPAWDNKNLVAFEGMQDGDVEPLISLLMATDQLLHPEVRLWLASMLRGDVETPWWLECKRHPGVPSDMNESDYLNRTLAVGRYIHGQYHDGATITAAKERAEKKFGLSDSTIRDEWLFYRAIATRFHREGFDFASGLKPLPPTRSRK